MRPFEFQQDEVYAEHGPRRLEEAPGNGVFTVALLCDHFRTGKIHLLRAGEITPRTLREYEKSCERLIDSLGKHRAVDDLWRTDGISR